MPEATKIKVVEFESVNPNDPNVRDPQHAHELGGTLGMTVGGVAAGIITGMAAGAASGSVAGPIGVVAGAALGGALGGTIGEDVARGVNPTLEEKFWEENFKTRPYVVTGHTFEAYRPAYRAGIDGFRKNPDQSFESLEPSLRNNWGVQNANSKLEWEQAKSAARDAFTRLADPVAWGASDI